MNWVRHLITKLQFLHPLFVGLLIGYGGTFLVVSLFTSPFSEGFPKAFANGLFLISLLYLLFGGSQVFNQAYTGHMPTVSGLLRPAQHRIPDMVNDPRKKGRVGPEVAAIACGLLFILSAIVLYRLF